MRAELLLAIGSLFAGVGAYEPAAEALEEARELRPRDPRVLESLALAKVRVAAYDEAEQLARRALSMREAEGPDEDRFTPLTTLAFTVLRNSRNEQERLEEAERLVARAVELAVAQRLPEIELGRAERLQASVLLQLGRTEEALEVAQRALDRLERSRAPAYELALAENNLALAEEGLGRTGAAIERLRSVASSLERVLGPEHPEVAGALHNVGNALAEDRRFGEAEDVFEVALERYERLLGAEHPMTLNCASSAAYALQESGELERAEVLHRRVASGLESALGGDHRFVPLAWAYVAENLALQGRAEEALRALERAAPAASGDEDWISLVAASISAFVTGQEGASPALEEELERTRRLLEERFGPHSRHARAAADRLARYRSRSAA